MDATLLLCFLWHHKSWCSSVLLLLVWALRSDVASLFTVVGNYPLLLGLPCSLIRALLISLESELIARSLALVCYGLYHLLVFLRRN